MRPRIALFVILLTVIACSVPPAITPTPTGLPVTPLSTSLNGSPPSLTATIRATAYIPGPTSPPAPTAHRIAIRYVYGLAEFYDRQTGEKFVPRGVNYILFPSVLLQDGTDTTRMSNSDWAELEANFAGLHAAGYNTLRIFLDGSTSEAGLSQGYLDNLVALMNLAKENGLFLLLASNDLPAQSSYSALADQGSSEQFAEYHNAYYLTSQGVQAYRDYWGDLLAELAARDAPFDTVLGWELVAEQWYEGDEPPFSLEEGTVTTANGQTYDLSDPLQKQAMAVDGMLYFSNQLRDAILSHDPTALVTMGLLVPGYPNPARLGDDRYSEAAALLTAAALDFFDLHAYIGGELTLAQYAENFGLDTRIAAPVIMGKLGALGWSYATVEEAAVATQDWIAGSCAYGLDGWLYWGYESFIPPTANQEWGPTDATWAFTDEDSLLMEAISPRMQPDACLTTVLPGRNLALGRPVSVSAALPDQSPELAVDGTDAQWSAGAFPEQWLMIDLGAPQTIGSLHLLVGQWPAGQTVHQLYVAGADGAMRLLVEFRGYTRDYDLLEFVPPAPLTDIQYIRVVTVESPSWVSWREIEVLAPFRPTPTPTVLPTETPEGTPTP